MAMRAARVASRLRRRRTASRRSRMAWITAEVMVSPVSVASSCASLWASESLMLRLIFYPYRLLSTFLYYAREVQNARGPRQGPDDALVRRGADCGGVRSWAQAARREGRTSSARMAFI